MSNVMMRYPSLDSVKFNRALARLFYLISGLPRCSEEQLKNEILVLDLPAEEVDFFTKAKDRLEISHILWFLWYLFYIFKGLYVCTYIVFSASMMEVGDGIEVSNRMSHLSSRGCLITNCTRLSKDKTLSKDLIELPIFAICHPNLNRIYIPLINTHTIGLNMYTVFTYFMFIVGIFFPIENYMNPQVQESRVLPYNPTFSVKYNRERARRYLVEVFTSMKNYYSDLNNHHSSEATRDVYKKTNLILETQNREDFLRKAEKSNYLAPENSSLDLLRHDYINLIPEAQSYVTDCVPLARTHSWATRISELRAYMFIALFLGILMVYTMTMLVMIIFAEGVADELRQMDSYANSLGCGIWIERSIKGGDWIRISLGERVKFHNLAYVIDYLLILIPACFIFGMNVVDSIVSIEEVNFMLNEQLVHIDMAIKYADLLHKDGSKNIRTKGVDIINGTGCFNMNITRISTTQDTGYAFNRPKPLSDQYVLEIIAENHNYNEEGTNLDSFVDLVTKIIVSNRIIKHIAHNSSPSATVVMSSIYAASYGSVAIAMSINRKFESTSLAPVTLAMIGLVATNTLIIMSSRVQSTTNTLIQSIWRLAAKADDIVDFRVRHIRRLMIKQALVISFEGVLKIKAFGMSIGYASLIEALIWSTTMAIYSYNTYR